MTGPLSDAEKARIREEEIERAKIRAEIASESASKPMRSGKLEKGDPKQNQQALSGLLTLFFIGGAWWWLSQPHAVATTNVRVTYSITSSCPVDVTYTVSGLDTQQESKVPSGWTKTVQQSSLTNQLIAQLQCEGGTVTATVSAPGQAPKSVISSGDYTIASVAYP